MIGKDITRPEAKIESGRLTEKCVERSNSMRKMKLQVEFSNQVLKDDERTRATSSCSSARASET